MQTEIKSLFDVYPDKVHDSGLIIGYTATGSNEMLKFPCSLETGNAVMDAKGRWNASDLGLEPVHLSSPDSIRSTEATCAWIYPFRGGLCTLKASNKNIERIRLVDGTILLGNGAFSVFENLIDVEIPEKVTKLPGRLFYNCSKLKEISIPSGVTEIDDRIFEGCSSIASVNDSAENPAYCSIDGVLYAKDVKRLIKCPRSKKDVVIPDGVTVIEEGAFCSSIIESVVFPDSLTEIGDRAFSYCGKLTSADIRGTSLRIGSEAFKFCYRLGTVILNEGVMEIGDSAFSMSPNIREIRLPSTLRKIGEYAFSDCPFFNERGFILPEGVTEVGAGAFYNCRPRWVRVPSSVKSVYGSAFESLYKVGPKKNIFIDQPKDKELWCGGKPSYCRFYRKQPLA